MEGYSLEQQITSAGIHYPRSYDITYRVGYVIQTLASIHFVILYYFKSHLSSYALGLFEAGITLSAMFLLVWKASIKRFILRCIFIGIILQIASLFNIPFSEKVFFIGLGFTLAGGAGLAGKEAYCFGFMEGWLLLVAYPLAVIPNLLGLSSHSYNLGIAVVITLLQISFLRKKLSQPLLKSCEGSVCGLPEKREGQQ